MLLSEKSKGKVFYGQNFLIGESITTVCAGQLSATYNATEVAQLAAPGCSRPQPSTQQWYQKR